MSVEQARCQLGQAAVFTLAFIGEEKNELSLMMGPPTGRAELVVGETSSWAGRRC